MCMTNHVNQCTVHIHVQYVFYNNKEIQGSEGKPFTDVKNVHPLSQYLMCLVYITGVTLT